MGSIFENDEERFSFENAKKIDVFWVFAEKKVISLRNGDCPKNSHGQSKITQSNRTDAIRLNF